jgi:hypothetical protein
LGQAIAVVWVANGMARSLCALDSTKRTIMHVGIIQVCISLVLQLEGEHPCTIFPLNLNNALFKYLSLIDLRIVSGKTDFFFLKYWHMNTKKQCEISYVAVLSFKYYLAFFHSTYQFLCIDTALKDISWAHAVFVTNADYIIKC